MARCGRTSALVLGTLFLALLQNFVSTAVIGQQDEEKTPFSFEDLSNSDFQYRGYSVQWLDGEDAYLHHEDEGLMWYDIAMNESHVFVPKSVFDEGSYRYYFSADMTYILFGTDVEEIWRHSFLAVYKLYNLSNDTWIEFPNYEGLKNQNLQYAAWAPSGQGLVFVSGNNLYYQEDPKSNAVQATTDGDMKYIFNGIGDWSYEEDVLWTHVANWWSTDGSSLCYAKFNDTDVPLYKIPIYGDKTNWYGEILEFTYPKAGDSGHDKKPTVELYVMNTNDPTGPHQRIPNPTKYGEMHYILFRVVWRDDKSLTIVWLNRAQNEATIVVCDLSVEGQPCQENYVFSQEGGWVEGLDWIYPVQDGAAYLAITARNLTTVGSWTHLVYVTSPVNGPGIPTFLTDRAEEVKSVVGYDKAMGHVYYISTNMDPMTRHLFRVGIPGSNNAEAMCLTCDVDPDNCEYVSARFSKTGKYYIRICAGPKIPTYTLMNAHTDKQVRVLEDNADIEENLSKKLLPRKSVIDVEIGGNFLGKAQILVPPKADEPGNTEKFPLLVSVYAGPQTQAVTSRFSIGYTTYLASSHNIAVAQIDGRGTTSRGNDFMFEIYRHLGDREIEDQILGTQHIVNNINYIDKTLRVGIYGWSYGGYSTSHSMGYDNTTFSCGICGAGYTDWRFYDYAYIEKVMGSAAADDNLQGYEKAEVTQKAANFRNKKFLLIHGTADDNVHFGANVPLVKALQQEGIPFNMHMYPDKNHYFGRRNTVLGDHLMRVYNDFWLNTCWAERFMTPILPTEPPQPTQPPNPSSASTLSLSVGLLILVSVIGLLNNWSQ